MAWATAGGAAAAETELKPDRPQPYIVKKGDTLWDISRYFFSDPLKWRQIWERNRHIIDPDLIYPGNEIWFDVRTQQLIIRPAATTVPPAPRPDGEQLFSIILNGEPLHETVHVLFNAAGVPSLRVSDMRRWRLRLPDAAGQLHDGERYLSLARLPGVDYEIDERAATLSITAVPQRFETTQLTVRSRQAMLPQATTSGMFLNYDLTAQQLSGVRGMDGLFELGLFGYGTFTSNMLGQQLNDKANWIRLESSWRFDQPASMTTLRLGDAVGVAGAWGRSVRFGGLQWGTNFATRPGFVPFVLPSTTGEAALPSTVDLFINDVLTMRQDVPAGPFQILDPPTITGAGEMRIVVSDLLGRQQVITQSYYATPLQLAAGLHDYSYELGVVREDFGLSSNSYGRSFAAVTHRYGFSDWFTGEGRAELLRAQQTVGASGFLLWRPVGVFSLSLAGSRDGAGRGGSFAAGFEHAGRPFGMRLSTEAASRGFVQLGLSAGQLPPKRTDQAFLSWTLKKSASLGAGYVLRRYYDQPTQELLTMSYSQRLGDHWSLNLSASRDLRARSNSLFATLTRPLGPRSSLSATASAEGNTRQASVEYQQSLPAGSGVGYRLRGNSGDTGGGGEAMLALQNDVGTYTFEAARQSATASTDLRLGARGGLAMLDGDIFPTRYLDSSFAAVAVPGYEGVRVYTDNQLVARTDADGRAFVPRLRPYERNPVSIALDDLPLDAQIDAAQIDAVPGWRSGIMLKFPARPSRGALLRIVVEGGRPLPAGAEVRLAGRDEHFPVGRDGKVYLTGLGGHDRVQVGWQGGQCEFDVDYPEDGEPVPDLGDFFCTGVKP